MSGESEAEIRKKMNDVLKALQLKTPIVDSEPPSPPAALAATKLPTKRMVKQGVKDLVKEVSKEQAAVVAKKKQDTAKYDKLDKQKVKLEAKLLSLKEAESKANLREKEIGVTDASGDTTGELGVKLKDIEAFTPALVKFKETPANKIANSELEIATTRAALMKSQADRKEALAKTHAYTEDAKKGTKTTSTKSELAQQAIESLQKMAKFNSASEKNEGDLKKLEVALAQLKKTQTQALARYENETKKQTDTLQSDIGALGQERALLVTKKVKMGGEITTTEAEIKILQTKQEAFKDIHAARMDAKVAAEAAKMAAAAVAEAAKVVATVAAVEGAAKMAVVAKAAAPLESISTIAPAPPEAVKAAELVREAMAATVAKKVQEKGGAAVGASRALTSSIAADSSLTSNPAQPDSKLQQAYMPQPYMMPQQDMQFAPAMPQGSTTTRAMDATEYKYTNFKTPKQTEDNRVSPSVDQVAQTMTFLRGLSRHLNPTKMKMDDLTTKANAVTEHMARVQSSPDTIDNKIQTDKELNKAYGEWCVAGHKAVEAYHTQQAEYFKTQSQNTLLPNGDRQRFGQLHTIALGNAADANKHAENNSKILEQGQARLAKRDAPVVAETVTPVQQEVASLQRAQPVVALAIPRHAPTDLSQGAQDAHDIIASAVVKPTTPLTEKQIGVVRSLITPGATRQIRSGGYIESMILQLSEKGVGIPPPRNGGGRDGRTTRS